VVGTVNASGTIVSARKLDVYGAVRQLTGSSGTRHKFVGGLGHPSEGENGLVYMRARWMDPVLGRFASEDPGRQGLNWYMYCANNPANAVDADGRLWRELAGVAAGIYGLLAMFGVDPSKYLAAIKWAWSLWGTARAMSDGFFEASKDSLKSGTKTDAINTFLALQLAQGFAALGAATVIGAVIGGIVLLHALAIACLLDVTISAATDGEWQPLKGY
jgi:RHS repeat-associated protein